MRQKITDKDGLNTSVNGVILAQHAIHGDSGKTVFDGLLLANRGGLTMLRLSKPTYFASTSAFVFPRRYCFYDFSRLFMFFSKHLQMA